jgi:hypothetical protein
MAGNIVMEEVGGIDQNEVILNRDSLYEIMVRNSWYLANKKCAWVTVEYMLAVREKKIFCPKYGDIRLLPCTTPPKKQELMEYIRRLELDQNVSLGINNEGPKPNVKWLIKILSTYCP